MCLRIYNGILQRQLSHFSKAFHIYAGTSPARRADQTIQLALAGEPVGFEPTGANKAANLRPLSAFNRLLSPCPQIR